MTALTFAQLDIENFKSFVGLHSLELADTQPGLHFMSGRNKAKPRLGANGVGKTSIWDAMCWCLYGRTPSGLKNPDIMPWYGKSKRTKVGITLKRGEDQHRIERTANPNELTIDGKTVGQEQVESLVGMNVFVFTNTILMGQGQPLFFDLEPRQKMQLFVDVLSLDKWDERSTRASKKHTAIQTRIVELGAEITGYNNERDNLESMLKSARTSSDEWEADRKERLEGFDKKHKELTAEHEKVRVKLADADLGYDGASVELKAARAALVDLQAKTNKLRKDKQARLIQIGVMEQQQAQIRKDLKAFGDSEECPICGQSIKGTDLAKHKKEMKARIDGLEKDIVTLGKGTLTTAIKQAEMREAELRTQIDEFEEKADKALASLNFLRPRAQELSTMLIELEKRETESKGERNPYLDQVNDLIKRRKGCLRDIEAATDDLSKANARAERTKYWVKGFKDIRLYVINEVLDELEMTTNSTLEEVGLVDWSVEYTVEKETRSGTIQRGLSVLINSPDNRNPVRWESWSGGEGQRLRLVGALALSEVLLNHAGIIPNIEILDEPTQHLSTEGVRDLCDYLAYRAEQLERQTWFIDHMAIPSDRFDSILTVVKDKDGSHLEFQP